MAVQAQKSRGLGCMKFSASLCQPSLLNINKMIAVIK